MNRYERPKGLTSYETVEQFIKAMNAGNDINGFLEQEVNDKGSSDVQFVDVTIERVKEDDEMAEYHVVMTEVHKNTSRNINGLESYLEKRFIKRRVDDNELW